MWALGSGLDVIVTRRVHTNRHDLGDATGPGSILCMYDFLMLSLFWASSIIPSGVLGLNAAV